MRKTKNKSHPLKKIKRILDRDSWKILYGMFSNWGLIVISMLTGTFLGLITGSELAGKLLPLIYLTLSIGFYLPIKKSKDFRLGYIIGFILGEILLIQIYLLSS